MITTSGIAVPPDMVAALEADPEALSTFETLGHDDQLAYVNWLAKPGSSSRSERLAELGGHVRNHRHRATPAD